MSPASHATWSSGISSPPPTVFWSLKGGSGVTVIAVALATLAVRRGPTLLVDLCGDAPAALGMAEPSGPGVWDWLGTEHREPDALWRLSVPVGEDLELLPAGRRMATGTETTAAGDDLLRALLDREARVIVDAGCPNPGAGPGIDAVRSTLMEQCRSLLVTRACYLGLRRAARWDWRADGALVMVEPGRSLDAQDITDVLGVPVLAEVPVDPAMARATDAGVLVRRVPRLLARSLEDLS